MLLTERWSKRNKSSGTLSPLFQDLVDLVPYLKIEDQEHFSCVVQSCTFVAVTIEMMIPDGNVVLRNLASSESPFKVYWGKRYLVSKSYL